MSSWAAQQAWKRAAQAIVLGLVAFSAPVLAVWLWYTRGKSNDLLIPAGIIVVAALMLLRQAEHLWKRAGQAAVGASSERRVVRVIKRHSDLFFNNCVIGSGGDADHILLFPRCAVIETKTGKGEVRASGTSLYVGKKKLLKDPVGQVNHQAHIFERRFKVRPLSIVCVVDATNSAPVVLTTGEVLCSANQLPEVLRRYAPALDRRTAMDIAAKIKK